MTTLVTGGAGYIGAHVCKLLADRGERVVVVDDLVTGVRERVGEHPFLHLDLADSGAPSAVAEFAREHGVDAVVHFAARKQVGESVAKPALYYRDNLAGLAHLLLAMEAAGCERLVFSSSAAVYGAPDAAAVSEDSPTEPINPYGETKLYGERLIRDMEAAGKLRAINLRYFNVAGAANPLLGDRFALNLIPMVIERVVAGEPPRVFGDDYPTPDGTCIRDYVHVVDLAEAHLAALDQLRADGPARGAFNIGTGRGSSVLEVIEAVGRAAGQPLTPAVEARRPGDPPALIADVTRAAEVLGWRSRLNLDDMAESAWQAWTAARSG